MLAKVMRGGCGPPKRRRWPIIGHAPPASGGVFFWPVFLRKAFDIHGKEKRKSSNEKPVIVTVDVAVTKSKWSIAIESKIHLQWRMRGSRIYSQSPRKGQRSVMFMFLLSLVGVIWISIDQLQVGQR
ncbi:hypothetical protein V6N12_003335 [Hibiscus sabdariffa]|uniref:Uncharacterized protein n=1 Tax=Hibiscus sabdariffa TaxID=183260 RepID=A0ABR2EDC2_9ROSI